MKKIRSKRKRERKTYRGGESEREMTRGMETERESINDRDSQRMGGKRLIVRGEFI